jgi:hypothetical protein
LQLWLYFKPKSWFDRKRFWHNEPAKSLVDKRRFLVLAERASQSTHQDATN